MVPGHPDIDVNIGRHQVITSSKTSSRDELIEQGCVALARCAGGIRSVLHVIR